MFAAGRNTRMRCTARSYSRRYLGLLRCRFGRRGRHRARGASSRPPRVITSRRSARPAAAGAGGRAGSTGCTRFPLSILRGRTGAACTGHLDGDGASTNTNSNPSRPEQPAGRNKPVEGGPEKPVEGGELDASHSPEGRGIAVVLAAPNGTAPPRSSRRSGRRPAHRRSVGRAGRRGRWQGAASREHAVPARPATDRREDSQAARGMLLCVGAVLVVNGVWLIGQARAARRAATCGGSWRRGRPRRGGRRPIELGSGPRRDPAAQASRVNSRARRLHTTRRASVANRA
jgi:hypothetical protein